MRHRPELQVFEPEEVDFLQQCFDHIVTQRALERKSEQAEAVAKALLTAYQRGVKDRQELIALADVKLDS